MALRVVRTMPKNFIWLVAAAALGVYAYNKWGSKL